MTSESWFILIETLQQVETLMSIAGVAERLSAPASTEGRTSLAGEMSAVNAATKRMFDSTRGHSDNSFAAITQALLRVVGENAKQEDSVSKPEVVRSPTSLMSPIPHKRSHRPSRSISGLWTKTRALDVELTFVLGRIKDLIRVNIFRFASLSSSTFTWDLIIPRLINIAQNRDIKPELRLKAADIVSLISVEVMKLLDAETLSTDEIDQLQCRCLEVLASQMPSPEMPTSPSQDESTLQHDLHKRVLEALENILGQSGHSFAKAWPLVFQILESITIGPETKDPDHVEEHQLLATNLTPVAFRCVQLICNDFLHLLGLEPLERLIQLLGTFGQQENDLNMSLTTTNLLRNIASLLQSQSQDIDLEPHSLKSQSEAEQHSSHPESSLWTQAVTQLVLMCRARRVEIRDGSLSILLQTIESAGEQLLPQSFRLCLHFHVLPLIRYYNDELLGLDAPNSAYSNSLTKALTGTTALICNNISRLVLDHSFKQTWEKLLGILSEILAEPNLELHTSIFASLRQLLDALTGTPSDFTEYVTPVLSLWALNAPKEVSMEAAVPNYALLEAHIRLFVQAHASSSNAAAASSSNEAQMAQHVTRSIRDAILTARHAPYTNDVRKPSPEQDASIAAIGILGTDLLKHKQDQYVSFIVDLVQSMMLPPTEEPETGPKISNTKKYHKPTFIAVASQCLDLLRDSLTSSERSQQAWKPLQLQQAFEVLSTLINTKYTNVPTNADAPLWQTATITAVAILEATRNFEPPLQDTLDDTAAEALNITITACLTSILGSGGLESRATPITSEQLSLDETFDIAHFERFHKAAIPLISSQTTSVEQRKRYILSLFNASLIAKPWFFDFPFTSPTDVSTSLLKDLMKLRNGSVHPAQFVKRMKVTYAALDALFDLATPTPTSKATTNSATNSTSGNNQTSNTTQDAPLSTKATFTQLITKEAAPYLLLRIAHPMKTFLADQPLSGLTPLPMPMQRGLAYILQKCLDTRCYDAAFLEAVGKTTSDAESGMGDGRTHLRLLFPLLLKVQKAWRSSMRIPGGKGWQDDVVGREIEGAMERWVEAMGEGWNTAL